MIKICYYSHTIDFAGTWRSHEKIFENIDRSKFDPYIMYWDESPHNNRLDILKQKFGSDRFIPFKRSLEKTGASQGYAPVFNNFKEVAIKNNFDIIHFARSGYYEWPFNERISKLQIETNIFGANDKSIFLDKSIAISPVVHNLRGSSDIIIPNPIDLPKNIEKDFSIRKKFNIKDDDIVLGRIGRPDNFTSISLIAFSQLQKQLNNIYYLIIGGCDFTKNFVFENKIKNVHFIDVTNDDEFLDKFNRNIDIFSHYRSDGETFGVAIATAMSYAVPVLTHVGGYNNQCLTIKQGGIVANNQQEYFEYLRILCSNPDLRNDLGNKGRAIVEEEYDKTKVVKNIENKYIEWLK